MTRLIEILISLAIVLGLYVLWWSAWCFPRKRHLTKDIEDESQMTIVYDTLNSLRASRDWNVVPLRPAHGVETIRPEAGVGAPGHDSESRTRAGAAADHR